MNEEVLMDPIRISIRLFFSIPVEVMVYLLVITFIGVTVWFLEEIKEGAGQDFFEVMMDVFILPLLFFFAIFSVKYSERFNKALFSLIEKTYTPGCF